MDIRVAVIGAGSWGTTVAHLAAHNTQTVIWARSEEVAAEIAGDHRNSRYLPDYDLHPDLEATADLGEAVRSADVIVMGVPSHAFRSTAEEVGRHIRAWVPVVSLAKGLEELRLAVERTPETNIIMFHVPRASALIEALRGRGVLLSDMGPNRLRAVTQLDVTSDAIDEALRLIADVLKL